MQRESKIITGFIVAMYFSLMMASFSAVVKWGMDMVLLVSWSICISRLPWGGERGEGRGGRGEGRGEMGGRGTYKSKSYL